MQHPNIELITRFYEAFARLESETLAASYHPEAQFTDEVFVDLNAAQAAAMWRMLCSRAKDFSLTFSSVEANDTHGKAHWEAVYTFTSTGKRVHNVIDAEFEFKDGKIYRHRDRFDFYEWSRQALGFVGLVLGNTGYIRRKVKLEAAKSLAHFMAKK
jgi:ketosteroid isomerase-like protein